MQHADQKYIDALINNDYILIEEIYHKYSGRIKGMVIQNNGSEANAADVFQDVLMWIYKKAKSGSFTLTCPLEAFLYMACKKKWMSELKKRKSDKVTINDLSVYNIDDDSFKLTEEFKLQQERKDLLNDKLAELGGGCREILQLSWSGKSMEDVAKIMNITYGYARKRKSECMAKLVMMVKQSSQYNSLKW